MLPTIIFTDSPSLFNAAILKNWNFVSSRPDPLTGKSAACFVFANPCIPLHLAFSPLCFRYCSLLDLRYTFVAFSKTRLADYRNNTKLFQ